MVLVHKNISKNVDTQARSPSASTLWSEELLVKIIEEAAALAEHLDSQFYLIWIYPTPAIKIL